MERVGEKENLLAKGMEINSGEAFGVWAGKQPEDCEKRICMCRRYIDRLLAFCRRKGGEECRAGVSTSEEACEWKWSVDRTPGPTPKIPFFEIKFLSGKTANKKCEPSDEKTWTLPAKTWTRWFTLWEITCFSGSRFSLPEFTFWGHKIL